MSDREHCWRAGRTLPPCVPPLFGDGWLFYRVADGTWWRYDVGRPEGERIVPVPPPKAD